MKVLLGSCAVGLAFLSSPALPAVSLRPTPVSVALPSPGGQTSVSSPAPPPGELTASDVKGFLDGLVPSGLDRDDVAGAVVVVVKDGKVLFASGYGFADVEKRKPVSVEDTLFRPGSTSKLFTWTSVMQLLEQGKLDLDRDVNVYLDFKIPAAFAKPITLRDIMTHTAGFEETAKDLFVAGPSDLKPLGVYLPAHLPARIFPPGTTPAYSNYATAVAGYIIERVSGRPYNDYVEEFILRPLGMSRSTFRQPLPASLEALMSKGYRLASDKAQPYELVNAFPAGALAASGGDMARFMIAHLQDGRFGEKQILRPETARLMHARQRGKAATLNAMALGFYEESRNGVRIIGHAGDTNWFHSDLHLVPEAGLGFFISFNSAGRADFSPRDLVWKSFVDRYFPFQPPAGAPVATAASDARTVAGAYLSSRRGETNFLRLLYLLLETTVAPDADGTIRIAQLKDFNGKPKRWREVGPLTYREVNGQEVVVFQPDYAGRLELAVSPYPFFVFTRPAWFENRGVLLPVAIVTAILLFATVVLWPIGALLRRHYGKRLALRPGERRLRLLTRLACTLQVTTIAVFAVILVVGFQDITLLSAKLDPWLRLLQVLVVLSLLGVLVALVNCVRAWSSRERRVWGRIGETVIALACLGFAWLALVGRLLAVGPVY